MAELTRSSGSARFKWCIGRNGDGGRVSIAGPYLPTKKNTMRGMVVHNGADSPLTCAMLLYHGLNTINVGHGYSALNLIASGEIFHIIVIGDLFQFDIGSLELTRRIRVLASQATIISISTILSDEARRLYMEAGVNYFLEKPITSEALFPIVAERFLASTRSSML